MVRQTVLSLLLLFPTLVSAQINSQFIFNGQNAEVLTAQKTVTVVTPEQVEVPDTCTRQVPNGQIRVCRDVTRYREQCTWIPSRQDCGYESERVCKPVSRSRQICTGGGSRQECSTSPSRTVCYERPTREVCRTDSSGQQRCTTVGGGQNCQQVGGERTCRDVPIPQSCRTDYYTEQECGYESRYRCQTIPGRNDCNSVPYSDEVCGMETQYRTESYACTRTVTRNREETKVVKLETNVQINTNGLVEEFPVSVLVQETSAQFKAFTISVKLEKEPKLFVILKAKDVSVVSATKTEIQLQANVVLDVMTLEMLPISLPSQVASVEMESANKRLIVAFEGVLPTKGKLKLKLEHKVLFGRKVDAELEGEFPSAIAQVGSHEGKYALFVELASVMKNKPVKSMKLALELEGSSALDGELLNTTKPEAKRFFDNLEVKLK